MITAFDLKNRTIISYAIRKLTPRECFRLMAVPEPTIDVMQTMVTRTRNVLNPETGQKEPQEVLEFAVSASQQYKQAGNSIVCSCLEKIYNCAFHPEQQNYAKHCLGIDPLAEEKADALKPKQLNLFDMLFA